MAIALKVIYTVVDNKGKTATTEIKVPTGFEIDQYIEFAQQMAILINDAILGRITNVSISIGVDLDVSIVDGTTPLGLRTVPNALADVEEKGAFQFSTVGGWKTKVNLPTINEADVLDGTDTIGLDPVDQAAQEAFASAMLGGITLDDTDVIEPSDGREDDIATLDFARERFQSSGKRS